MRGNTRNKNKVKKTRIFAGEAACSAQNDHLKRKWKAQPASIKRRVELK